MKTRIKALLDQKGLTSAKFADLIGVQRSSISHILSGRNNPSLDFIQKLLIQFPEINTNWLLLGVGDIAIPKTDQTNIIGTIPFEDKQDFNDNLKVTNVNLITSSSDSAKRVENTSIEEITKRKEVIKIVYFYNDNTFLEFFPAKA